MSNRINITESLKISNVNEDTCELASVIKPYIEQLNGMIELRDLRIYRLYLSVDGESVEIKDIKCYEPDNCFVMGEGIAAQRQITHCVISKEHKLFALLDKLAEARDISLEIEYSILHDDFTSVYGSDFFDLQLRDMHELLSGYVEYKCCMHYEELSYEDNVIIYRFDEVYSGEVPYSGGNICDNDERNWTVCNFIFEVGAENEVEREKAISILKESFAEYGFEEPCYDEECVWIETNYLFRGYRISDFIEHLNKAIVNISCIDSEPYASLSVFSTDDEYVAGRIYTENGKLVTDWCC